MAYTTINKSSEHFNTKLYTGNATNSTSITGVGFQPDLLWIKDRTNVNNHSLQDAVRGAGYNLQTNTTNAQGLATETISSFDTDGWTMNNGGGVNGSGAAFAAWNWKANGAGSANTDGTVNSTVSVNSTSGFSIVSWTHNGSANYTVGHGLGATPNPCPTVALAPVPVQDTILNPLVVLAETVELIEPTVLAEPAPFAFQFHDT